MEREKLCHDINGRLSHTRVLHACLEHACWSASRVYVTLSELRNYENQVKRQGGVLICGYC